MGEGEMRKTGCGGQRPMDRRERWSYIDTVDTQVQLQTGDRDRKYNGIKTDRQTIKERR